MPKNKRMQRDKEQIENTIDNLAEAKETLMDDTLSDEERARIEAKNKHREEQISSLKQEVEE